jgi:hypothetical protein
VAEVRLDGLPGEEALGGDLAVAAPGRGQLRDAQLTGGQGVAGP